MVVVTSPSWGEEGILLKDIAEAEAYLLNECDGDLHDLVVYDCVNPRQYELQTTLIELGGK